MLSDIKSILASEYGSAGLAITWDSKIGDIQKVLNGHPTQYLFVLSAPKGFGKTTLLNALGKKGFICCDGDIIRAMLVALSHKEFQSGELTLGQASESEPALWTDKWGEVGAEYIINNRKVLRDVLNNMDFVSSSEFPIHDFLQPNYVNIMISYQHYVANLTKRNTWRKSQGKKPDDIMSVVDFFEKRKIHKGIKIVVERGIQGILDFIDSVTAYRQAHLHGETSTPADDLQSESPTETVGFVPDGTPGSSKTEA